jgi:signal peptidase I
MPSANGGNTAMVSDFTVPADDYFVMGDNRQASSDSREWGFLPKEDIIGRVIVQAFPLDRFGIISHARYGE